MRACLPIAAVVLIATGCSGGNSVSLAPQQSVFQISQVAGTFYVDATGPTRSALDPLQAGGRYFSGSQQIVFDARMAGPILSGDNNYYVWGIQRGSATTAPFPDEPNVKFDAVVVATVASTGATSAIVNRLDKSPPTPVAANLTAPDTIEITIPISAVPPTTAGITAANYTWNLWPRSGVGGTPAAQIAAFIPNNALAPLLSVNQ